MWKHKTIGKLSLSYCRGKLDLKEAAFYEQKKEEWLGKTIFLEDTREHTTAEKVRGKRLDKASMKGKIAKIEEAMAKVEKSVKGR